MLRLAYIIFIISGLTNTLFSHRKGLLVQQNKCSICQSVLINTARENEQEKIIVWCCGHCFHSNCIINLTSKTNCPECKTTATNVIIQTKHSTCNKMAQLEANFIDGRPDLEGHF